MSPFSETEMQDATPPHWLDKFILPFVAFVIILGTVVIVLKASQSDPQAEASDRLFHQDATGPR